jgi:hypothetical protein
MGGEMRNVYFLLGDFLGKTPRRCELVRKVSVPCQGYNECWLAHAYPPIAGQAPDDWVLFNVANPKKTMGTGVTLDVLLVRRGAEADIIDWRDLDKVGIGHLALPEEVSRRAFPYPCDEPMLP